MRALSALVGAFVLSAGVTQACDIIKDPLPSWEQMIDEMDVVFVGTAVGILPATKLSEGDTVTFEVEMPVKGGVGRQFEYTQGTSTCDHTFEVGAHVIFAGRTSETQGGEPLIFVEDTGWDPTVHLSDPPTAAQMAQLNYLKQIAEDHPEGSK